MWREMMCAFTLMQTPDIKIAICRPHDQPGYWDLARDHFGCQIPFVANDTPAQVLAAVRANPTTLGVVPVPIEADVGAVVAVAGRPRRHAAQRRGSPALSRRCPTPVPAAYRRSCWPAWSRRTRGDDRALVSIEAESGLSRNRISGALAKVGLPRLHVGAGPGLRAACITTSSSCRA